MHPVLKDYWANLQELHEQILSCLEGLPPSALDCRPGVSGFNSPSVLVVHLAGAERYWFGDVVGREPSQRDREAEFQVQALAPDELRNRLAASQNEAGRILETLSPLDLEAARTSPRDGRTCTVGWALAHVLEHSALHLGHLQITRQLWELAGKN